MSTLTPEERQAMRERLAPASWTFATDATPRWSARLVSGGEVYMLEAWAGRADYHMWRVVHLADRGSRVLAGGHWPTLQEAQSAAEAYFVRRFLPDRDDLLRLLDALDAAEARVGEARALLGKLEWAAENDCGDYCPACGNYRDHGHAPDCPLAAWLAKTAPKEADHG